MYRAKELRETAVTQPSAVGRWACIGHTPPRSKTHQDLQTDRIRYFRATRMKNGAHPDQYAVFPGWATDAPHNFALAPSADARVAALGGNSISENVGPQHL
jgi:acetaldehyde dehydrogenase/alcohol dehydrogenase